MKNISIIYIKEYNILEGKRLWLQNPVIGEFTETKMQLYTLGHTFTRIDHNATITISGKRVSIRITPLVDHYYIDPTGTSTIQSMLKQFANLHQSSELFYTYDDYEKIINDRYKALNQYHYKKYSQRPHAPHVFHYQVLPPAVLQTDNSIYEVRNPPIRFSSLANMSSYKKQKLLYDLHFIRYSHKKSAMPKRLPHILNATYISTEYSPYIEDQDAHLHTLIDIFTRRQKQSQLKNKRMYIHTLSYMRHLLNSLYGKRSKLDYLVDFIRINARLFYTGTVMRMIYDVHIIPKNVPLKNGMYIVRRNGRVTNIIHACIFQTVRWATGSGTIDLRTVLPTRALQHLYVQYGRMDPPKKVHTMKYVIDDDTTTKHASAKPLHLYTTCPKYPPSMKRRIYFIQRVEYPTEKIIYDVLHDSNSIRGSVRVRGILALYMF